MLHITADHTEIIACMKKTLDTFSEMCDNRFMVVDGLHIEIVSYMGCDDGQNYHVVTISEIQDVSNIHQVVQCSWELEPQDYYFFVNDLPAADEFFIKTVTEKLKGFHAVLQRPPTTRVEKVSL